jgi:hypothetical protein
MSGFQLPSNFVEDPEQLLRIVRRHQAQPQRFISNLNLFEEGGSAPIFKEVMAQKTISEYSTSSADYVALGPQLNLGDATFEFKPTLINMVQVNPFSGKPHEDVSAQLQHFLELCAPQGQRVFAAKIFIAKAYFFTTNRPLWRLFESPLVATNTRLTDTLVMIFCCPQLAILSSDKLYYHW